VDRADGREGRRDKRPAPLLEDWDGGGPLALVLDGEDAGGEAEYLGVGGDGGRVRERRPAGAPLPERSVAGIVGGGQRARGARGVRKVPAPAERAGSRRPRGVFAPSSPQARTPAARWG